MKMERINNKMNRITKSRKRLNASRKGRLQVLGNIGSGHRRTKRDKRKKIRKDCIGWTKKLIDTTQTKTLLRSDWEESWRHEETWCHLDSN